MKTHRPPSKAKLQKIVDQFNTCFPVGSTVLLRKDTGVIETTVRGPAIVLSGHSAVAFFEGVSGAYSVENDRVTPRFAAGGPNITAEDVYW